MARPRPLPALRCRVQLKITGVRRTARLKDIPDRVASGGCPPEAPTDPNVDNGTLTLNTCGTKAFDEVISGSGRLVQQGPNILLMLPRNYYTGEKV